MLVFLLDTFSLSPQAHFPLLDRVWKDNTEPHAAARRVPPGRTSFQSERVISGQNCETIEGIWEGMVLAVFVSASVLYTLVCFYSAVEKNLVRILENVTQKGTWECFFHANRSSS